MLPNDQMLRSTDFKAKYTHHKMTPLYRWQSASVLVLQPEKLPGGLFLKVSGITIIRNHFVLMNSMTQDICSKVRVIS